MAIIGNPIIAAVKTEVDSAFDENSTNPVQNRVIAAWTKEPELTLYQDEESKLVYISTLDGVLLGDGILVEGGGGGGGGTGGNTYKPKLVNLMESRDVVVAQGGSAVLSFRYTSVDDEGMDDGAGVGTIKVNGVVQSRIGVPQGENNIDISSILGSGSNTVIIMVENSEGITKQLKYSVSVVSLSLSTTFSELANYSGIVTYSYTVTGAGTKVMHFIMDGVPIGTDEITSSGRSHSFEIPTQSHGGHVFEAYATLITDGMTLRSETLRHGMLWIDDSSQLPAISSTFDVTSATEGEILSIPYIAYDPLQENATVTLTVFNPNDTVYSSSSITVDRLPHTWNISNYPNGNIKIRIACGSAQCEFPIAVAAAELPVDEVTDSLVLKFDPTGRSNGETNPAQWTYDSVSASFTGFGWNEADGWIDDDDGATVLRFLPGDTMTIPFQPFATDARQTGYTIEVEMATRDVRDYESIVVSCMSGGRGFKIASQEASLNSEQSGVSILFREDSRVRVSFSIENRNLNRLIYIYINGVMCGVTQYPADDNFQQANPVGITIGAQSCGLDLYKIRCYNKGLTRAEQLDNFIMDRSTLAEREDAAERNDILDSNDEISIATLPDNLPYILLRGGRRPQSKDEDDATIEVEFVDPLRPDRCWTATGVKLGIQGTSSAGYPIKNWKIKLKNGIVYVTPDTDGEERTDTGFPITEGQLPTKTICWKADFASSENANNIVLAKFYNDLCPYKTPAQEDDPRVRQGVDGFPAVLFWQDTTTGDVEFLGKGNCNIDKGNDDIFGLTTDYPHAESWEFLNNTSARSLFKSADFTSMGVDKNGNPCLAWQNDFEARYPDDSLDISNFATMAAWVVSTDRDAVNSAADKAARLQKFHDEFSQHFVPEAMFFYYIFTETFLLMDNRAKNMFMTTFDGVHWFTLPYDFDSCLGINNEGSLAYEYHLEDTDQVDGDDVFTGQNSVLWNNVRDAFPDELRAMYRSLRSLDDGDASHESPFSYYRVAKLFTDHQGVWPEVMWNEDAFIKYLQPYFLNGEDYLDRLQGNKASQRDWWLYYGFGYRDSKYQCGDAASNRIVLRAYEVADITVTPYSNIWGWVRFGSYDTFKRCMRNNTYTMECNADNLYDTETYIYSAHLLSAVGGLPGLKVGECNIAAATKLRELVLGDEDPNYTNPNLGAKNNCTVGNNDLLELVNVANCTNFGNGPQKTLDLSGCTGIKTVIATGTALRSVALPNGGHLQTLKLPATITNFTILNQQDLTTLSFEAQGTIETLRVENTPNIPVETLLTQNANLSRVRIIGLDWTVSSASALQTIYNKLVAEDANGRRLIGGMDANGDNTSSAVLTGIVRVSQAVDQTLLDGFTENFPDLLVMVNGSATCTVRFRNWDGTVLDTQTCQLGGSVVDPITAGRIQTPSRPAGNRTFYTYRGWDKELTNVQSNMIVTAVYDEENAWEVTFRNDDAAHTVLYTALVHNGQSVTDPVSNGTIETPTKETDSQYVYTYLGWDSSLYNVTADRIVTARYSTSPSITVIFRNWDETELLRKYIASGSNVADPVTTEEIAEPTRPGDAENQINYVYDGWDTSLIGITENTTVTATFTTIQYYIVIFKNPDAAGGTVLYTTNVNRNGSVTDPVVAGLIQTPTRAAETTYSYIYKGWDAAMSNNVTSNLTYTAQYKTDRQFVVTFYDDDQTTVLDTQLVYDEADAIEPVTGGRIAQPAKASTAQYTYAYNGWDKAYTNITADTNIYATYTATVRSYTYRFLNNDNSVLKSGTANYGTTVTPPSTNPSYTPANEDMVFNGWLPDSYVITANTDFVAQYLDTSSVVVKYLKRTLTAYESNTATTVAPYAFYSYTGLTSATTSATSIGTSAFQGCTGLTEVDLTATSGTVTIAASAFSGDTKLAHLIIRSSSVATLSATSALTNTAIANGKGAIYVPSELVDTYKAASNWSTYASQIYPISAYPVTDFSTISDSWAEIFAAEDDGTYSTKYHVGDTKQLSVNGELAYAQIVAMDTDTLTAGGTAKITWILEDSLSAGHRMNATNTNANGWPVTEMRTWLRDTILPTLDSTIRANIKEVSKTSYDYTTQADLTSNETIWLPSLREMFGASQPGAESSGCTYTAFFNSNTARIKTISGSAASWWLRSANSSGTSSFWLVSSNGTADYPNAYFANGVAFGFCT